MGRWAGMAAAAVLMVAGALPAAARELSLEGPLTQGGLVIGRGDGGIAVTVDGRAVRVSPEGLFLVGFGRDAPPTVEVRVRYPDGVTTVRVLDVARRTYQVQRIDGLAPRKVTPPQKDLERIRLDGAAGVTVNEDTGKGAGGTGAGDGRRRASKTQPGKPRPKPSPDDRQGTLL